MSLPDPVSLFLPEVKSGSPQYGSLVSEMHDRLGGESIGNDHSVVAKIEGHILEQFLHGTRSFERIRAQTSVAYRQANDLERFIEAWNNVYTLITNWVQAF